MQRCFVYGWNRPESVPTRRQIARPSVEPKALPHCFWLNMLQTDCPLSGAGRIIHLELDLAGTPIGAMFVGGRVPCLTANHVLHQGQHPSVVFCSSSFPRACFLQKTKTGHLPDLEICSAFKSHWRLSLQHFVIFVLSF